MVRRTTAFLLCIALAFSACATKHALHEGPCAQTACSEVLIRQTDYTPRGLPAFTRPLGERPARPGDSFTIVQLLNGRPARSYDIVVVELEGDFARPFKVMYEWTGRGFAGGARVASYTLESALHINVNRKEEAMAALGIVLAPVVIGTAGGFVIGIADGVRATAAEIGKVVAGKQERIVAYTTYDYDDSDRLVQMRMFNAAVAGQELVRTEYTYAGDGPEPRNATITSFPSGDVRIVE